MVVVVVGLPWPMANERGYLNFGRKRKAACKTWAQMDGSGGSIAIPKYDGQI